MHIATPCQAELQSGEEGNHGQLPCFPDELAGLADPDEVGGMADSEAGGINQAPLMTLQEAKVGCSSMLMACITCMHGNAFAVLPR